MPLCVVIPKTFKVMTEVAVTCSFKLATPISSYFPLPSLVWPRFELMDGGGMGLTSSFEDTPQVYF